MAEALAIEGAKWVASTIVTGLLKEGFSNLGIGISAKINDLETTILPKFQFVIEAAERSTEHKDKFQLWLRELKDAAYEAEDVLDEYKYQLLEEKVSDLNTRPELKPLKKFARKVNTKLSILSPQKIQLRKSLNKLEVIAAKAKEFRELLQIWIGNDGQNLRNEGQPKGTSSFPLHKVFGRDKERDEIIDKYLLDPSEASEPEKNYSVGAIVAIGGAGKTTLAQLVYRDTRVDKHFDIKMWVSISRKLDLAKHTKDMIESSGKSGRPDVESSLEAIQSKLAELVKLKKVLLVLDDVWFDRSTGSTEEDWQTLLAPLAESVKSGSKVLVTTRTKNLPVALDPQYSVALKDLEENHILSLFKFHAFGGNKLDDSHLEEELMTIGKQIVQKLHGSPLAAKAVGCQLRKTLKVKTWKAVLGQNNLRDSQQALLWSYQHLDAPLQRCFSYCSLFPKGHKYEAEKMVHLWIAEGFINSSNNSNRMEDIGMEYFDELVSGSFLQKERYYTRYYMHDLFHDLAEKVSKEDCLRIEGGDQEKEIPPTIRHLSIWGENNMSLNQLKSLRTLMIQYGSLSSHAIDNLFAATDKCNKKLRVLSVHGLSKETFIKVVPNQKHLRFLSFHWSEDDELPATLGKLYHLQVIDDHYSDKLSLPRSAKNLINLRHCITRDIKALKSLPDIGRLTSLQTLQSFVVKKEKGHDIGQLKNLNELRGSLTISNLENVEGKDRAVEANLKDKRYLESLHLKWGNDDENDLDMEVLEGLQPHSNLTELSIEGCKSPRYPSWLVHLTALTQLSIYSLPGISSLPEHLHQSLRKLVLWNCPSISSLPEHLPQSLGELYLKNCLSIFSLPEHLPQSLKSLDLNSCPSISSLPKHLPQSLKSLDLNNCPSISSLPEHLPQSLSKLSLKGCPSISSLPEHLPESLEELSLSNCHSISSLPEHLPQSLNYLYLYNCPSISSLPEHLPQSLGELHLEYYLSISSLPEHLPQSLRELNLKDCPSISCLPEHLPQSLGILRLENCPSISCLPEHLPQLLAKLVLSDCHNISSLPEHLPQSLNYLHLENCPSISSLPEHLPQSLVELFLGDCLSISSLPENLPQSLGKLVLWNCPSISSLPEHLPQSLRGLNLGDCPSISSLPEHLPQSLWELNLEDCPSISSLPEHLPQSLDFILIRGCQILKERCRSPNGKDWPKIAYISCRHV